MNTSQKRKIAMVLSSFNSKFEEGFDFFDSIAVVLVSGKKEYKASIVAKSQTELDYIFLVKKTFDKLSDALEALIDDILKYDSAVVSYIERGSATDVIIDDRNVKVSKRKLNDEVTDTRMLRNKEYIINPSNAAPLL